MKFIYALLISLILTNVASAERQVLFFHYEGCKWCPVAEQILLKPTTLKLVSQYHDNWMVDIHKFPAWKTRFKITTVPTILIIDVKDDKFIVLYTWKLQNDKIRSESELTTALKKYAPVRIGEPITPLKKLKRLFKNG